MGACLFLKKPSDFQQLKNKLFRILSLDWQSPEMVKQVCYGNEAQW